MRRCLRRLAGRTRESGDAGFTLIELAVTAVVMLATMLIIPAVVSAVSSSSTVSNKVAKSTSQASLALQSLSEQVGSALEVCLPTDLSNTKGFALRALVIVSATTSDNAIDTTYRWEQWQLNTSTGILSEERAGTQTTTATTNVPWPDIGNTAAWYPVATGIKNDSSTAPFSLATSNSGQPQEVDINLQVATGNTKTVSVQSSVAALDAPYVPSGTAPCSVLSPAS